MAVATSSIGRQATRSIPLLIFCGSMIAFLSLGERSALGLFQVDMVSDRGWSRDVFSLAFALQNLLWGLAMPIAGALADRWGTARTIMIGAVLYGAGLALSVWAPTPIWLHATLGILVGVGIAASSFTLALAAIGRHVPPHRRPLAFGIATAAGSLGMFAFGPISVALIGEMGWERTLILLGAVTLLMIPLAWPLRGTSRETATERPPQTFAAALKEAFGYRSYVLLIFGFFVCGFHVAFIIAHMPAYLNDLGFSPSIGAWALALIGLFNVVGSVVAGAIGTRYSKAYSLSAIYLGRAIAIALFVSLPVTAASVLVFSAVMGLFWLSTVPLTSGLVAVMFGPRYMATLFGFVFLSHQIGSFLGVWVGGLIYEQTGSYDMLWWIGVLLGLFAALVHLPIRDAPVPEIAGSPKPAA